MLAKIFQSQVGIRELSFPFCVAT